MGFLKDGMAVGMVFYFPREKSLILLSLMSIHVRAGRNQRESKPDDGFKI